jgi:hypothetical protein
MLLKATHVYVTTGNGEVKVHATAMGALQAAKDEAVTCINEATIDDLTASLTSGKPATFYHGLYHYSITIEKVEIE